MWREIKQFADKSLKTVDVNFCQDSSKRIRLISLDFYEVMTDSFFCLINYQLGCPAGFLVGEVLCLDRSEKSMKRSRGFFFRLLFQARRRQLFYRLDMTCLFKNVKIPKKEVRYVCIS